MGSRARQHGAHQAQARSRTGKRIAPVGRAYYIATLTRHRGWSEDFVRWQLPPWRGYAYLHADLMSEGIECVWVDRETDTDVLAFRALRDQIMAEQAQLKANPPPPFSPLDC